MAISYYSAPNLMGLSSDTKPEDVGNGTTFLETDTGLSYCRAGGAWVALSSTPLVLSGAQSARPSAGTANRLYIPTDGYPASLDSGSAWYPIIDGIRYSPPPAVETLTQVGFIDETTLVQDGDGWLFTWTGDGVATSKNIAVLITIPEGTWTLTIGFDVLTTNLATSAAAFGLCVTDGTGATPKAVTIAKWISATAFPQYSLYYQQVTFPATWSSTPVNLAWPIVGYLSNRVFMRLTDDETNLITSLSMDGRNWMMLSAAASVDRDVWCTPTHVGLFAGHGGQSTSAPAYRIQARVFHWELA